MYRISKPNSVSTILISCLVSLMLIGCGLNKSNNIVQSSELNFLPKNNPKDALEKATVAIGRTQNGENMYYCTAVAIRGDVLLTAHHCLCDENSETVPVNSVFFGTETVDTDQDKFHSNISDEYQIPYSSASCKDKNEIYQNGDIAIIFTRKNVTPFWLEASHFTHNKYQKNQEISEVRMSGFGLNDVEIGFGFKMSTEPTKNFELRYDDVRDIEIVETFKDRGIDTCDGDSGGGMFYVENNSPKLLAITSRPSNSSKHCGQGGFYTSIRTASIQKWIHEMLIMSQSISHME